MSACTEEEEDATTTGTIVGPRLLLDRSLTTLKIDEQGTVKASSDDGEGNAIAFTTTQADTCVTTQTSADQISIAASGNACTNTVTVSAGDKSVTTEVAVIDPAVMDIGAELIIKYTNIHTDRWKWRRP